MLAFLSQPWAWYVSGPLISLVMFALLISGQRFGVSSSFDALASLLQLNKVNSQFNTRWQSLSWLMVFVLGSIIGGFIANTLLSNPQPLAMSSATLATLQHNLGITDAQSLLPASLFNWQRLLTPSGFTIMVIGGVLIGFGSRWAAGCTSGHAISGISNLQLASMLATIGFFVGGLFATHVLMPLILG